MDSTFVTKETIQIVFGDNGLIGIIIIIASFIISLGGFVLALLSYLNSQKQTKISEEAKEAALISANTSVESARTAEKAVGEGFRALLQVNTIVSKNENDLLDLARLAFIYPELNGFPVYSLFLTNIGNRQCKNIQIQVKPALLVLNSNRFAETSSKEEKSIFFEDFLNINQSICLNKDAKFIAINNANTLVNFTITYEDLTGTPYKPLEFRASLDSLKNESDTIS